MTITINIYYLILIILLIIIIFLFLFLRLLKIKNLLDICNKEKTQDLKILSKKILSSAEDNLNLFFKFEAAILESIRLSRMTKLTMKEIKSILSEVRLLIEPTKK
jgi:hypothetical protein